MTDPITGPGGSGLIDPNTGNLSQDVINGNFDKVLGSNSSLGPDSLALLKAQQKMALDSEIFQMLSKEVSCKDEAIKGAIQNIH